MRGSIVSVVVLVTLVPSAAAALQGRQVPAADFVVARNGSDSNPGTLERPFATLARAQAAVRKRVAAGLDADLTVLVRAGTYWLSEPLTFGPLEAGTSRHAVTYAAYPGERVIISGGRPINGWQRGAGPIWTARVPAQASGRQWTFRNLFVNGRRAVRARSPNRDARPNCRQLQSVEYRRDGSYFALTLPPGLLGSWPSPPQALEVMIAGNWAINRKRVERIEVDKNQLVLAPPHRHGPSYIFPRAGRWFYLENARELLDQPGEWFLDRQNGLLSYWPRDGEDMGRAEAVAPVLTQLVVVRGTAQQPVRNLHFKGLHFEHTDWHLPAEGYMGIQACHYGRHDRPGRRWRHIPAAVLFAYAENCSIQHSAIAHLGGTAIELADRCSGILIQGNHIFDASANGVMVGGPNSEPEVPKDNRVCNNHIHACGREYYGAVGIWVGFAQHTLIAHNLVHDLPYTGISVGWQWNPQPTPCRANVIEYNHVHDVMNRLCDGGCIYTLGLQPGTVIRGNHLHDAHRSPLAQGAPNNGMFIDQGSKGYLFERNVIYNTHAQHVRFNQCARDWHTWRDNYFGDPAEVKKAGKQIIARAGLEPAYRAALLGER